MTHHLPVEAVPALMLRVDDILSENPPPPGAEAHLVTLLHGKEMTLLLAQIIGSLKPHIHTTHEETIYVLRGSGQALVGGRWEDLSPGTVLHFQDQAVHSIKAAAGNPLVFLCHFVPGMKEMDRIFVENA
jgi:quercetin dioxygenase-like cupin family protein